MTATNIHRTSKLSDAAHNKYIHIVTLCPF